MAWAALLALIILLPLGYKFGLVAVAVPVVVLLAVALAGRFTLYSGHQARRIRWRIRLRLRPGPGFATLAEIVFRWALLAALRHGHRARASMGLTARLICPRTEYAIRLGRAQYCLNVYARQEDMAIIMTGPRGYKTALLGDWLLDWRGAALVTETRPDLLEATAGHRAARYGPVHYFNPENVAGYPSTFRWALTDGCENPAEALRRAADMVDAVATEGDMQWWAEKAASALGAALHAAALTGRDIGDVWAWANGGAEQMIAEASQHPGLSRELFGALRELRGTGKTAESIRITMSKALSWVAVPAMRGMVTGPEAVPFDVGRWVESRGTIYMLAQGGDDGATVAPLFRCFASYVHRAAKAYAQMQPGRRLDPRMGFFLDELHMCLAAGSLVLTRDGYVPIETVKVGDRVLTHRGLWRRVTATTCNGVRPTVQVHAQGVPGLQVTPDHRLRIRPGHGKTAKQKALRAGPIWMQAGDTLGSYVNLPLPPVEDNPISKEDWWIVGRWLGDGHRGGHGNGSFYISCAHDELPGLLDRLGRRAGYVARYRTCCQVRLRLEEGGWLQAVLRGCGQGAAGKRVPAIALALHPGKAGALLDGYMSADGSYLPEQGCWRASSVSRALLLGMAMVAQRALGVVASVYAGRAARKAVIEGRAVECQQEWTLSFSLGNGPRRSSWIGDEGAWKKVRKIRETDAVEVWDLQVEGDESFVAEGCVVHNCPVDLPAWSSDSAAWGCWVAAVVHSSGQLLEKYGDAGTRTVMSNMLTKLLLPGIHDTETLGWASQLCGRLPGDAGDGRPDYVFPVEAIARMPLKRALVIRGNLTPAVVRIRPWWTRKGVRWLRLTGGLPRPPVPVAAVPYDVDAELDEMLPELTGRVPGQAPPPGAEVISGDVLDG